MQLLIGYSSTKHLEKSSNGRGIVLKCRAGVNGPKGSWFWGLFWKAAWTGLNERAISDTRQNDVMRSHRTPGENTWKAT